MQVLYRETGLILLSSTYFPLAFSCNYLTPVVLKGQLRGDRPRIRVEFGCLIACYLCHETGKPIAGGL